MNRKTWILAVCLFLSVAGTAAANEIVVLKGGKSLELSKPYLVKGSQAVMTLKDGTVISVPVADVDKAATAAARAKASAAPAAGSAAPAPATPVEAARAQQAAPKARVKLGDDDVSHGGYEEPANEGSSQSGEGSLQVVDWDQKVNGENVSITGTLRNTGKAVANNLSMSVSGKDDAGKTVATASADIAAGALEPGASAGFTATLNSAVRLGGVRFAPKWTTPAPPKTEEKESAGTAKKPAVPAPAKPPAQAEEKKPAYTPNPNYAPPTASAPTTAPSDGSTGYVPGAHEETPPPPPPPPR
jgi:hypothetical protein